VESAADLPPAAPAPPPPPPPPPPPQPAADALDQSLEAPKRADLQALLKKDEELQKKLAQHQKQSEELAEELKKTNEAFAQQDKHPRAEPAADPPAAPPPPPSPPPPSPHAPKSATKPAAAGAPKQMLSLRRVLDRAAPAVSLPTPGGVDLVAQIDYFLASVPGMAVFLVFNSLMRIFTRGMLGLATFPPALVGMFIFFFTMIGLEDRDAAKFVAFFDPAVVLLTNFLPVFFLPGLLNAPAAMAQVMPQTHVLCRMCSLAIECVL